MHQWNRNFWTKFCNSSQSDSTYVSLRTYLLGHEHFLNVWILCEKIKCQRLFTVVDEFNGLGGWIDVDDWKNRTENFLSHYPVLWGQIRQNGQFNESRLLFEFSSWNWIKITKGLYKSRLITFFFKIQNLYEIIKVNATMTERESFFLYCSEKAAKFCEISTVYIFDRY